jgi:hypothetical protein
LKTMRQPSLPTGFMKQGEKKSLFFGLSATFL